MTDTKHCARAHPHENMSFACAVRTGENKMTDRFTPGPWRLVENIYTDRRGIEQTTVDVFATCNSGAPVVYGVWGSARLDERHANGKLIAVAPELLEACRRLLGWSFWDQGGSAGRDAEFARAVIAKATGEKEQEKPE